MERSRITCKCRKARLYRAVRFSKCDLYICDECGNSQIVTSFICPLCQQKLIPMALENRVVTYSCEGCNEIFTANEGENVTVLYKEGKQCNVKSVLQQ